MQPSFVHLRFHSEYSVTDGIVRLGAAVKAMQEWNTGAFGLTDLMNMFGSVRFYEECHKKGIKPVLGCDLWMSNPADPQKPNRLTVYCMDHDGYHSLCVLLTRAWLENQSVMKGRGEVREEWLKGEGTRGLICLTGGPDGEIQRLFARGKTEEASLAVRRLSAYFPGRFYLELQRAKRPGDEAAVRFLCAEALKQELPVVATHPVQFQKKEDFIAHEVRVCIAEGYTLADPRRPKPYTEDQYLKSPEEMRELFADIPAAIENTVEIAKRCNVDGILSKPQLPLFETPEGMTLDDYIDQLAHEGLEERLRFLYPDSAEYEAKRPEYLRRLEYELSIIKKMQFPGYFLIVQEFINWSKTHGVPVGPGRGSGAGSLVAYSLRITDMDPLHYNLLFERFLNPERVSMPDFDVDFCQWNRDRTIQHVKDKYGAEAVSQIATFGAMGAKAVVRDVGRVLGLSYGKVDDLAKLIPAAPGLDVTLESAQELEPEFKAKIESDEQYQELMRYARPLEGITRNLGMHAGGVLIAPGPLTNFCPLYNQDGAPENTISQFDKHDVESVGLVKFDFLGLTTLTIISKCIEYINQLNPGTEFDLPRIPTDDKATLELFQNGNTTAVFQFESPGMRQLLKQAHPDRIEDLVALNALYRPGPMEMIPSYIARKSGTEPVTYLDDRMGEVLKETYGIMVYQEQVMQVAQKIGGYTLGGADLLRRAMGKKLKQEMDRHRGIFVEGAAKNNVSSKVANEIFDLMAKFAGYGFNKSHAVAYSYVAYQTAYLKAHYPAAFMAANMCLVLTDSEKIRSFIEDVQQYGVKILPPDVNKSDWFFTTPDEKTIRYGLGGIKGVGEGVITEMMKERQENGPFLDLFDFCSRMKLRENANLSKRVLEGLIKAGAFDSIDPNRAKQFANIDQAMKAAADTAAFSGQGSLFGEADEPERIVSWIDTPAWGRNEQLLREAEVIGFCLTGHLFGAYEEELRPLVPLTIRSLLAMKVPRPAPGSEKKYSRGRQNMVRFAGIVTEVRKIMGKKGQLGVVTLNDGTASIEMLCFGREWELYKSVFIKDDAVIVSGSPRWDEKKEGVSVSLDFAENIQQFRRSRKAKVCIELSRGASRENLKALKKALAAFTVRNSAEGRPLLFSVPAAGARGTVAAAPDCMLIPSQAMIDTVSQAKGVEKALFLYGGDSAGAAPESAAPDAAFTEEMPDDVPPDFESGIPDIPEEIYDN